MAQNNIDEILNTTLENLRTLVDVNTIVGEPIAAPNGTVILPVSRVSFGFVAGGGEYGGQPQVPGFAGGTGGGVTVTPIGFLIAGCDPVRMIPAQSQGLEYKLADVLVQLACEAKAALQRKTAPAEAEG